MEKYSWKLMNDGRAAKELDYSAFAYNGSGIPQEFHEFFGIDESDRVVSLRLEDKVFQAKIQWQVKGRENSPSIRIFWDKLFTKVLKDHFQSWTDLEPGSKATDMTLMFGKTAEIDVYTVECVPGFSLNLNEVYKRTDIHDYFGGNRQRGISYSTQTPQSPIFLFSQTSGEQFGYEDDWDESGEFFTYSGEGKAGDMKFSAGNLALRDHISNNRNVILMIETEKKGWFKYEAALELVDWDREQNKGGDEKNRLAIKFLFKQAIQQERDEIAEVIDKEVGGKSRKRKKRHYKKPDQTSRRGLVTTRVGQGAYRRDILEKFGNQCAISNCAIQEILIASHIVPWKDSSDEERLDPDNGILLSPAYDALFDRHLISFSDEGGMIISCKLAQDDFKRLSIDRNSRINVTGGMRKYLQRHRESLR